ncbi:MAG: guanylate cyclase [Coxiella sp. RIFCSPHIGHO2_12_FULL_42_15]|nr:MAG: guanylate cyclase [Coxiella sp. RIFCSPHIGHO2_12_FULL_42_15]
MKGLIFREFLNFVETKMTYATVDKLILKCKPQSGGAYTTIGTYDPEEIFCLLEALSQETDIPPSDLLKAYGEFMFGRFADYYPHFFKKKTSTFDFLPLVESSIHADVKKFYSDAELPHFQCTLMAPDRFEMIYTSPRLLTDFAEGLIRGCIHYHRENIELKREDIPVTSGSKAKFTLIKR